MITASEVERLSSVCEAVFAAQREKRDKGEAFSEVRAVYQTMLVDMDASPVALAIASIAAGEGAVIGDTKQPDLPEGTIAAIGRSNTVDLGIVGGAIGGAVIGGAIGGLGGAIIGGVVGGIAGGIGTACAT